MRVEPHFFEDFEDGAVFETRRRQVTDEAIRAFAEVSGDRNPLHLDEAFAAKSAFGERVAHGALGLSVATGLVNETHLTRGTLVAFAGLEWSFRNPIRIDDEIAVRIRVVGKRETSRPDRGLVKLGVTVVNQDDEVVQDGVWTMLVRKRSA